MPDILDHASGQTTKLFIVGDQGEGKTGSLIALAAIGYKIRILDFDNGADILKNLLTNYAYPYRKYMEENNIPLRGAINICTITEPMEMNKIEGRFVPKTAKGFAKAVSMIENWQDGDIKLGPIETWGTDTVLVTDTFGTLADLAYFNIQSLNSRLGARQEGYDYQRDVGGAQGVLKNYLQKLFSPQIKCNIICISHRHNDGGRQCG